MEEGEREDRIDEGEGGRGRERGRRGERERKTEGEEQTEEESTRTQLVVPELFPLSHPC